MKKKKGARKKPTTARIRRATLALWSRAVRARAGGRCEVCKCEDGSPNEKGNPRRINAHHIEDRSNQALRFCIMNGVALCPTCHKFGRDSAHRSPITFIEWLKRNRPASLEHIRQHRTDPSPTREQLAVLADELRSILHE